MIAARVQTPRALQGVRLWWRRKSVQRTVRGTIALVVILAGACVIAIPLAWMISASLKPEPEVFTYPVQWLPSEILWSNYVNALTKIDFFTFLRNTSIITAGSLCGQVLTASLVAYGFARLRAPGRDVLFVVLLSTLMLPGQVTLVPTYLMFRAIGWLNTYLPLIVPNWLGGGAFFIFLLRQFYATLPVELDDAAKIDGCSLFGIYWQMILPLSKPALATVAIFSFFGHWNDFMGPLIYLSHPETYTITIGLRSFIRDYGQSQFALLMAATLVSILPPVVVFFCFQRTFVQGIALTGLKG